MRKILLLPFLIYCAFAFAQKGPNPAVKSGPMVGYSEMREVMLWVQTTAPATVQFRYWERDVANAPKLLTAPVQTSQSDAFTAHCLADAVMPGKKYEAELLLDGSPAKLSYPVYFQSQVLWQFRTDPPTVRFAVGSCNYANEPEFDRPGKPYGGDQSIFTSIAAQKPDFMVWLGDNTYLREADWNTRTGILHRYTHTRMQPELQPLLSQAHHYAIWDDHDFGPNDSESGFIHKDLTLEAFKLFWANNGYGLNGNPSTIGRFQWADCEFFLLDNRFFRSGWAQTLEPRSMLGEEQLKWLIHGLKGSTYPFKFVCIGGMVLSTAQLYENYINTFPAERQFILDAIQRERIEGVVFLTGDRHHTELSKWHPDGGVPVYDLTVSPLTSGAYPGDGDKNQWLVKGTEVGEANFAVLEIEGPRKQRVMKITVSNTTGGKLWTEEIKARAAE